MKANKFFWAGDLLLLLIFLMVCVFFSAGCGRKAPPRPPGQVLPNPVNDLRKHIDGDTLKLIWTIPSGNKKDKTIISGFIVYRSKVSVAEGECPNCPLFFGRAGEVSAIGTAGNENSLNKVEFYDILEMGYSYTYKVIGYTQNDVKSGDSNHITFYY